MFRALTFLALVGGLAGCQWLPKATDTYADEIDAIGDAPPRADKLYRSRFDLTRIGRPDGPFGPGPAVGGK